MSDIFISYSRKDSSHALALAEQLRSKGCEVWIDQHGIAGSEKWATEIAEGIRECSTFIVLLSQDSMASENVLKELSLASEKRKRILPVDIHTVELPSSFEYALAGLQRVRISDFDGILRGHEHGVSRIIAKDLRKSLIVLPFEDLSPTGEDNSWFADGLAGEMIDALGRIKSLRILDRKTSHALRTTKLRTVEISKEFNTRYFIEGSVRKFGEQIKISVSLLDIDTGDYLWQESHKGKFEDIFEIQEQVAEKVIQGLKLNLTKEEQTLLQDRGTENAEAYELAIKAGDYLERGTYESFRFGIQLLTDAIILDPGFARAYAAKGNALSGIYRNYDKNSKLLVEAEELVQEALKLKPNLLNAYVSLSIIYFLQGKPDEAEKTAIKYVEMEPAHFSFATLGFLYMQTGDYAKAIEPLEQALKFQPDTLITLWNLVICCQLAKEQEKLTFWASVAITYFERHLKLHPDDESRQVGYAAILELGGRTEEARKAALSLVTIRDAFSLYNIACLWSRLGDPKMAMKSIRKSIDAGFKNTSLLKGFLEEEYELLNGTPEYEEVKRMVEKIDVEEKANG